MELTDVQFSLPTILSFAARPCAPTANRKYQTTHIRLFGRRLDFASATMRTAHIADGDWLGIGRVRHDVEGHPEVLLLRAQPPGRDYGAPGCRIRAGRATGHAAPPEMRPDGKKIGPATTGPQALGD